MRKNKQKSDITTVLKHALKARNNPKDLKAVHVGVVVALSPLTITISEGKISLVENEELYISEGFRFRCNIDSTSALSKDVIENCSDAEAVQEVHSQSGSACSMPSAVGYLSQAIQTVNTELLALKCNLKIGDLVSIGSLEQLDKYILIDKITNEV